MITVEDSVALDRFAAELDLLRDAGLFKEERILFVDKEEDIVTHFLVASAHSDLLFFTTFGNMFSLYLADKHEAEERAAATTTAGS